MQALSRVVWMESGTRVRQARKGRSCWDSTGELGCPGWPSRLHANTGTPAKPRHGPDAVRVEMLSVLPGAGLFAPQPWFR